MTATKHSNAVEHQGEHNPRPDIAFVFGIQDAATILGEQLCKEFGLRVHRAMKRDDPASPIDSLDDDAVIVPELGCVDTVHVCGMKVPENLCADAGGPVECNWLDDDATAFAYPLVSFLHAANVSCASLPAGWVVRDLPCHPSLPLSVSDERKVRQWEEAQCFHRPIGFFGPSGTVVADFGNGKQLLDIPAGYSQLFPMLENRKPF